MEYRKFDNTYYVRLDKNDEITGCLLELCKKEKIDSAVYSGIAGCGSAEIQTYRLEKGDFETQMLTGMLELASMNGDVTMEEDGSLAHHTHAVFAYKENGDHFIVGGHLKSATVLLTAEIELRPVTGGVIRRRFDPEIGIKVWDFD